ncbi:NERD domain-containing protein [Psychrobacillus glaciei]|uniref:NERD domain-containing protein n=1 Tax=Psychrobacillus glaciei TaxID=2283160 RepID=A0A5J6SIY2_9BACI|nr:nuclease-related domain-containing protein [Psychrobacillus glaciei]QFF97946.1 NERD domain-containing protein [Psychrobacillus glaciei]
MIAKKYSASLHVKALHTLHKRMPRNHPKYVMIKDEYYQKLNGEIGEEVVMKVFEQLKLPYKFYVFHNISLYAESLFQIDVLLITPYYAFVFEVKNIKGEIVFTDQQLTRTLETNKTDSYESPVLQLAEYEYQLNQIFKATGINLPIHGAVVFAFATSNIKVPPTNKTLLFRRGIKPYLRSIQTNSPILNEAKLDNLKEYLLKANIDFQPFPLTEHYEINPDSIRNGVECRNCGLVGMKKVIRNWYCPSCKATQRNAHEAALVDYFLVCKNTISNQECQKFLNLNNKHEATKILKSPLLIKTGQSRNSKYTIKEISIQRKKTAKGNQFTWESN